MHTCFVQKCIGPHNGLVRLYGHSGDRTYKPACSMYLFRNHFRVHIHEIGPCADSHYKFFHSRVPGPFTDSVDSAFDLSCAGLYSRQ